MKKLTLILTFLLLWTVVCGPWTVFAAIPHLISYQGRLTDTIGGAVPNNTYSVTFRIYTSEAGGADIWSETDSVTTREGIFEVLLGGRSALDLPFDTQYYLGIQVGSDPEMTPRQKLASSGYAFNAEKAENASNADTVDGIHASASPQANKLLPLDSNAKLPLSALKVYDSGWFAVSTDSLYTKTHNLGTTKVLWKLYFATDTSGSNMDEVHKAQPGFGSDHRGGQLQNITTTQISVRTAYHRVHDSYGNNIYTSGYYRIIGIALE